MTCESRPWLNANVFSLNGAQGSYSTSSPSSRSKGLRRLSPAVGSPGPWESVVDTKEPAKSAGSRLPDGSTPAAGAGVAAAGSAVGVAPGSAADSAVVTVGPPVASVPTGSAVWAPAGATPQTIERTTATASRTGLGCTIVTPRVERSSPGRTAPGA